MSEKLFSTTEDKYGLPRGLLNAVWQKESNSGQAMLGPVTKSGERAQGHFQFMPGTAKDYGLDDPNDLTKSSDAAGRYFRDLSKKYSGDVTKMLAAYNWGPGNVDKFGLTKMPAETRDYVATIAPKVSPQGMAAKVAAAKKEGYTDQEIFNYLANSEKHSAKIAAAKAEGYTEAEIAKHLGLKFDDLTGATASRYPTSAEVAQAPRSGWKDAGIGLRKSGEDTIAGIAQLSQEAGAPKTATVGGQKVTTMVSPFLTGLNAVRNVADFAGLPVGNTNQDAATLKQKTTERHKDEAPAMATVPGIVGNAAGTIAQLAVGGAGSPTLKEWLLMPDKAYKAAAGGAAFGFTQATGEGESRGQNALMTGTGALLGYGLGVGAGKLYNAVKGYLSSFGKTGSDVALDAAADRVIASGFEASKLGMKDVSPEALAGLKQQIKEALKTNPNPSPDMVSRMVDFAVLNIKGTKGQISRDPAQWASEFNMRQINTGVEPNPLMTQYTEAANKLTGKLKAMGASETTDPFNTGATVIKGAQAADAEARAAIDALYKKARDSSGRYADMDTASFSKQANDFLDHQMVGKFLPTEMRQILNDISSGKMPFNVNTMQQYQTLLANALRKAQAANDGSAVTAIRGVMTALNDAGIATTEGAATKASFDAARKAARARFGALEASKGTAAAVDDVAPDKFFERYILNSTAPVREVKALLSYMQGGAKEAASVPGAGPNKLLLPGSENPLLLTGPSNGKSVMLQGAAKEAPEAVAAIRQELLSHLLEKLNKGQASYSEALKAIGDQKLAVLLPAEDVAMLKTIERAAEAIKKAPEGAVPNRSGTASAHINMLKELIDKVSKYPFANTVAGSFRQYGQTRNMEAALGNPLMGGGESIPVNPFFPGAGSAAGTGASRR